MKSVVEVRSVSKSFGAQSVLRALDWSVPTGRVVGLLGRNGAGKTTLLECILGLREPASGTVRVFDDSPAALSDATRARIGYVPQQSELFEWLTPVQMLDYFRAMYPRWNGPKVEALLERWSIDRQKVIGKLSGGERQRLSIIRALAHDPELLVLDEPVASLDPAGRREFLRELVDQTVDRNTTVVFSTHILSDLERVAMDVAFLSDGRIALESPLDELLDCVRRISGPADALERLSVRGELTRVRERGAVTSVIARLDEGEAGAIGAAHPGLRLEPVGLEDLFIEVTR